VASRIDENFTTDMGAFQVFAPRWQSEEKAMFLLSKTLFATLTWHGEIPNRSMMA
jgi:hypothetical protein